MTLGVAVVGAGHWGRNIVRTFGAHPGVRLAAVCDTSPTVRARVEHEYPGLPTTDSLDAILTRTDVDAVAIATPAADHAAMAVQCLRAGRHVLCEKPLALTIDTAREVVDAARSAGRVMMVGHLLAYHPAMRYLRALIASGTLGTLRYLRSQRMNLGRVRTDESALWSFGPHDLTMFLGLVGTEPDTVRAHGRAFLRPGTEDTVFMHLDFPEGPLAEVHMSWLDPHKERRLTVVGSRGTAIFDDAHPTEKIRIYDRARAGGDIHVPHISTAEPLRLEIDHFVACVETGTRPDTDAAAGLRVVRILAAAEASLRQEGSVEVVGP
jgi:predicted dehydrogenase